MPAAALFALDGRRVGAAAAAALPGMRGVFVKAPYSEDAGVALTVCPAR
jgi:hypothetical protein